MISVLFFIHDMGNGGAERVLVNLVNNIDRNKFQITVMSLFGGGANERLLLPHVCYRSVFRKTFPGNSHVMKLLTPAQLHRMLISEYYDIEIAYLEGPSSRVISGCRNAKTRTVNWVHVEQGTPHTAARSFRTYGEAESCYNSFDKTICVSKTVQEDFTGLFRITHPCNVLYNTVDSRYIRERSVESVDGFDQDMIKLISVGTLKDVKGFDRLLRIAKKLRSEDEIFRLYILGEGPKRKEYEQYICKNQLENVVTLLGHHNNPYKYVKNSDLFICSSYREGFSTAVTESLIVGTPVVSTCCSGANELLGYHNEYGLVVENTEEDLYMGIKTMIHDHTLRKEYAKKASERGTQFSTENTVKAVEEMLMSL
ncbi:MAG: glycosyltransferase [Thermoguttaceae bacterium]|nr:glycosyltransferase [Thermoguttaceae bacterium]